MSLEIENIIKILSEDLDVDLYLDANQSCCIILNDAIKIQLELDKSRQNLILASHLFELAPGKFRENVLKAAIKSNYGLEKGIGTLSYLPRNSALVLYEIIPLVFLTESKLFSLFMSFYQKGLFWIENLKSSSIPQFISSKGEQPPAGRKA